ncbi:MULTISPECIES: DUF3034 family protein [unclassified Limnobacter]|uniref:DUF3034 family protein n=1 Tax=unclassified Limnobacter TaxID=2630203 RepID=UPI0025C19C0C|nr:MULTISPECIES: DUF3034 family protein [unclassified Limnobacter]MDP3271252.1 DUF3034 family protein [Limnobacter sp.]
MNQQQSKWIKAAVLSTAVFCAPVWASTGKLVLTGGVSTVEGAGGGGITPWAFIGTQATENELGFATNLTQVETQDYSLTTYGATVGWNERVEFSLGEQVLDTGITGTALTGAGLDLKQQIVGVKVRVFGDGVLDADTWYPQVAVGLQHKSLDAAALEPTLTSLGADDSGTDFYVTATKLFLKQGILVNGTLRATKANQNGLLGFGSSTDDSYELTPEISVAKLLSHNLAIGAEYRMMPNNLEAAGRNAGLNSGLRADDWMDLFVAWAPTKNLSLTAAYVDLGRIVPATTEGRSQTGFYLSAQLAF